jgi:putative transposase
MKWSRFSEQQIAFILRQAEEVCRKAGISLQTYYRWRKKYGGLMPSEMKRFKPLEEENARAEEARGGFLARQSHAAGCRKKKALKPARARQLVEYLRTSYRICIRRACGALRFDRSSLPLQAPPSQADKLPQAYPWVVGSLR